MKQSQLSLGNFLPCSFADCWPFFIVDFCKIHEHSLCFHWSSIYTKCTLVSFFFLMFCNIIEWFYRLSLALSMPVAAASLTETVKVNILSHPFFFLVLHVTRGFASLLPCKCQSQKWSEPVGMDRYIHSFVF